MERLLDYDVDFIRAIAGVRLAHLVCECARGAAKVVRGRAIVGRCLDDVAVTQDVDHTSIGWSPLQRSTRAISRPLRAAA